MRIAQASSKAGGWVAGRLKRIEMLVERAAGRKIPVEVEELVEQGDTVEPPEPDRKILENPVVHEALQLFDATIHSVRELPVSTETPGGAAEDV